MIGVEPRTSDIESDRSTYWATTTSQVYFLFALLYDLFNGLTILS